MSAAPSDSGIENPYDKDPSAIEEMDNENVIIIFENSKSCSIEDTLIAARKEWESRWRRLPFYLAMSQEHDSDVSKDDDLAVQCMRLVIQDILTSLTQLWDRFLDISDSHVSILEDTIYENPADESRADEIWNNSSNWLKIERLALSHSNVVQQLNINLRELVESAAENPWLASSEQALENVVARIQENLIKTTDSLSDLMYKSVGIRDTRHSLELSYSMWRLSWITFVFLPLTFTVGFFGSCSNLLLYDYVFALPRYHLAFRELHCIFETRTHTTCLLTVSCTSVSSCFQDYPWSVSFCSC